MDGNSAEAINALTAKTYTFWDNREELLTEALTASVADVEPSPLVSQIRAFTDSVIGPKAFRRAERDIAMKNRFHQGLEYLMRHGQAAALDRYEELPKLPVDWASLLPPEPTPIPKHQRLDTGEATTIRDAPERTL